MSIYGYRNCGADGNEFLVRHDIGMGMYVAEITLAVKGKGRVIWLSAYAESYGEALSLAMDGALRAIDLGYGCDALKDGYLWAARTLAGLASQDDYDDDDGYDYGDEGYDRKSYGDYDEDVWGEDDDEDGYDDLYDWEATR